jgi:hypothetical protein
MMITLELTRLLGVLLLVCQALWGAVAQPVRTCAPDAFSYLFYSYDIAPHIHVRTSQFPELAFLSTPGVNLASVYITLSGGEDVLTSPHDFTVGSFREYSLGGIDIDFRLAAQTK